MISVTVTFHNDRPSTIWNTLARKIGRQPTDQEAIAEVRRIMSESTCALATRGKLPHQRRR